MTADTLIRALEARRSGSCWMARCPAHDDRNPSLSIREVDGKVLVRCHAGCAQQAVIDALKSRGLWQCRDDTAERRRIVATYDYNDEYGELLYQVMRYEPKAFHQRRPDGRGGWIWKKGQRQVLYRLREVRETPIVFVVEGEKDVETLRSWGFVATTNAGGASAPWLRQYTEVLSGREVILVPDSDQAGRERVARIARALIGTVSRLVIFEPEGAKDITEWFERGHSECELIAQLEDSEVPR
jgi:DNA primase